MTVTNKMTATNQTETENKNYNYPKVTVFSDRCAGCEECLVRCPTEAIGMDNFSWTITINEKECVGCLQCVRTCPFSAIKIESDNLSKQRVELSYHHPKTLLSDRSETRRGITNWKDAIAEASRCIGCPDPTCVRGCPTHNNIPGFIAAIREGNLDKAEDILSNTTVLPDVCSRVCDQALQCEGSCTWSLAGYEPVAIGALERFITENSNIAPLEVKSQKGAGLNVAIVGAGPAGASAACELVENGAKVTVFEKSDKPGGLMRTAIPEFTLPQNISQRVWDSLKQTKAVTFEFGKEINANEIENLKSSYDAVIFAVGAQSPLKLPVTGSNLSGIVDAVEFLEKADTLLKEKRTVVEMYPDAFEEFNSQVKGPNSKPMILVLGAGNTAMDVARISKRLGADAICIDWMSQQFAPVRPDELEEARLEGVEIKFNTTVSSFSGDKFVKTAHLSLTEQTIATKPPKIVKENAIELKVDLVVMAMGFRLDKQLQEKFSELPFRKKTPEMIDRVWQASGITAVKEVKWARGQSVGNLSIARENARLKAGFPITDNVWVVGDALVGPSTVVEAMAHGKNAAVSILTHLNQKASINTNKSDNKDSSLNKVNVLVAYDTRSGNTKKAAELLVSDLSDDSYNTEILPVAKIRLKDVVASDLIVLGTWVEGMVLANVKPAKSTLKWIKSIETFGNKPIICFLSYGVNPKKSLDKLVNELSTRHGTVIYKTAIKSSKAKDKLPAIKDEVLQLVNQYFENKN